jgi:glycosyltransferase involved in cell wall biosynthesis
MLDLLVLGCLLLTIALAGYCTVIYPALLSMLAGRLRRPWMRGDSLPRVSVIIPAHNEAGVIGSKLENILAADYPHAALEVLVASDASTDGTDAIVTSFAPRARLIRAEGRSGKQVCLNLAADQATGEILVFTDAASFLAPDAIRLLVRHFADPSIGAVSSAIRVNRAEAHGGRQSEGEGLYLGADCALRIREGEISSVVGCVGACYAMRRDCFLPYHPGDCDDLAAVSSVVTFGKRAVMDPQVVSSMHPARDWEAELARKVRTIAGALDTAWRYRHRLLQSAPLSLVWFIVSHKLCRWLLPLSILASLVAVTIGAIFGNTLWQIPFALGTAVVSGGLISLILGSSPGCPRFVKPFGFLLVSVYAGVLAWGQVILGKKQVVWQPTPRIASKAC